MCEYDLANESPSSLRRRSGERADAELKRPREMGRRQRRLRHGDRMAGRRHDGRPGSIRDVASEQTGGEIASIPKMFANQRSRRSASACLPARPGCRWCRPACDLADADPDAHRR
jgi:hypothetical protein